jgi:hypothetical protein
MDQVSEYAETPVQPSAPGETQCLVYGMYSVHGSEWMARDRACPYCKAVV